MTIQLLTTETIGKIAAGEVVERPASVVKELLENAIDAKASRIRISLAGGGLELIEISDDGIGMSPGELPMAVQRHATSKLSSFDDLNTLQTLGFRGEALPSIAAVSGFSIRTRTAQQQAGSAIDVTYGNPATVEAVAVGPGTTIVVRDLFGNVPARRKFLKQPSTEIAYAVRACEHYAIAYPAIAMTLFVDGKELFYTSGDGDRISAATSIHGVDFGNQLLPIPTLDSTQALAGVAVQGWVGHPNLSRSHRQAIVLFLNGRWIQNRPLTYALEDAFHTLMMVGRHPVAFVDIRVDPALVDVNVHPTKAEVKFSDERIVARAVQRAAHAALTLAAPTTMPAVSFAPPASNGELNWKPAAVWAPPRQPEMKTSPLQAVEQQRSPTNRVPLLRVLGQVASSYIIAEGPEGLYLIDQHAAHERITYERFLSQIAGDAVERQPLLDPLVVELSAEELGMIDRSQDELSRIGFEIEPFGQGTVAVRAVPAAALGADLAEQLHSILQELLDGGSGSSWFDSVVISAACHTSIRAGQHLSIAEMKELIEQLEATQNPRACGHGRPTMLQISQDDLARQFSRR